MYLDVRRLADWLSTLFLSKFVNSVNDTPVVATTGGYLLVMDSNAEARHSKRCEKEAESQLRKLGRFTH